MANRRPNGVDFGETAFRECWQRKGSIKTVGGCDKSDQVDIVTKQKYRNFELELEWRVAPGANSGIVYLISEDQDQTWKTGPEMQVLDDDKHPDGKKPSTSAGSLFDLIAPGTKSLKPVGEYNKSRVVINEGHVEHWLNERKILEYDLGSVMFKELVAKSKFKGFPRFALNSEGLIALQYHGDDVWYRKIRIRMSSCAVRLSRFLGPAPVSRCVKAIPGTY